MGKVMRHTLGASLNIRHNLSSSKGPKPLQLKLLTTYIPKTSAFTLAFSTSQRLRTTRASARTFFTFRSEERFSRNAETDLVCRLLLEKKSDLAGPRSGGVLLSTGAQPPGPRQRYSFTQASGAHQDLHSFPTRRSSDLPLQLKLLTTYIPKTSAFTLAFSTSQRLRTTRASARTFFTFRHYITPSARNF